MRTITLILALFLGFGLQAQEKETETKRKPGEITFKTSSQCGSCKKRIEEKLNYTKGVRFAELDLRTKKVFVKYNPKRITEREVKIVVTELGYDAGSLKANPKKMKALPACCQPGGHDKM